MECISCVVKILFENCPPVACPYFGPVLANAGHSYLITEFQNVTLLSPHQRALLSQSTLHSHSRPLSLKNFRWIKLFSRPISWLITTSFSSLLTHFHWRETFFVSEIKWLDQSFSRHYFRSCLYWIIRVPLLCAGKLPLSKILCAAAILTSLPLRYTSLLIEFISVER